MITTAVGGTSHTQDANGNLTDDGTYEYEYDFHNHLIKVTDKSSSTTVATYPTLFTTTQRGRRSLGLTCNRRRRPGAQRDERRGPPFPHGLGVGMEGGASRRSAAQTLLGGGIGRSRSSWRRKRSQSGATSARSTTVTRRAWSTSRAGVRSSVSRRRRSQ